MSFMGDVNICCETKRRLVKGIALFNCLVVDPNYLVFNKVQKCRSAKKTVTIKNEHTHPRTITFGNNFPHGLSTICLGEITLLPQECTCVDVFFEPTASKNHTFSENGRFSLFIYGAHPKMAFEIPILIKVSHSLLSIPTEIRMPDTSPNVHCYYALSICNLTKSSVSFSIRMKKHVTNLRYMPCEMEIESSKCAMIYLEALSDNMCPVLELLQLRFADGLKIKIQVEAHMVPYMLYPSDVLVRFPCTQIGTHSDEGILLCNESKEMVKFKWCRRESKDSCAGNASCSDTLNVPHHPFIKQIDEYFQIKPKCGIYGPVSSESALISFAPPANIECQELPAQFKANIYLACSTDRTRRINISLIGVAIGPQIEFITNEVDLGTIFVGEKKCQQVTASNTGNIAGTLTYTGTEGTFGGIANAYPQEKEIEPSQSENFMIVYYAKSIGKFMEKLFFQIKYGERLTVLVKGNAQPLQIDVSPKKIDFGEVPICVFRQQNLKIYNSLKIPIMVTTNVPTDGIDDPLILMIDENKLEEEIAKDGEENYSHTSSSLPETQSNTHFSFWTYKSNIECGKSPENICTNGLENASCIMATKMIQEFEENFQESCSNSECICETSSSMLSARSKLSLEFNQVLESTSLIAINLVTTIKDKKLIDEPEADIEILNSVLDEIFTFEYFQTKSKEINYKKISWQGIPKNPREVLLKPNPLYIQPNQSVDYTVCLIPNRRGPITLNMDLRITPYSENLSNDDSLEVCSRALSMIIPITYNCISPSLYLTEEIIHIDTFVTRKNYFSFSIKNISNVDGFFCCNIIPRNEEVELLLKPRKSLIKAEAWRKIHGRVTVYKVGETVLNGAICMLGNTKPTMFKIIVNTKPPKITVTPNKVIVTQKVLQEFKAPVLITLLTPTKARISLSVASENFVSVEPKEAILEPEQGLTVTLTSYFYDNGDFKNQLLVDLHYFVVKVPLKYTVVGVPIEFTPNIRETDFDMGVVFTSQNPYKLDLFVHNLGQNPYKVSFKKLQNKGEVQPENYFKVDPRSIYLNPKEMKRCIVSVKSTKKTVIEEEFSVDGVYGNKNTKFHDFNFFFKAEFVRSLLKWSKDEIVFNISNSELCENNVISEKVSLLNSNKIPNEVDIAAAGSFTILDRCKRIHGNRFNFLLQPKECKEFEIFFDMKHTVDEKLPAIYQGKVVTKANGRLQKCLLLTARMVYPVIEVNEEDLHFFARKQQFYTFFKITNPGCLTAVYKWRLIEEIEYPLHYVKTKKMTQQKNVSQELLSKNSLNLLHCPVDIEEQYCASLSKFIEVFAESEDENETETETTITNTNSKTEIKKGSKKKKISTRNKSSEESIKEVKKSKTQKDNKEESKKGAKKQRKIKEEESKTKKSKKSSKEDTKSRTSRSRNEGSSSLTQRSFTSLPESVNKNPFDKYPLDWVKLNELVKEVDDFLKDSVPKDYVEDLCEHLAPSENLEEHQRSNKHLFLDHYKGVIGSENCKLMNIFFSGHDRDVIHKAKYELEVAAGNSKTIDIIVYNLNAAVELSQTHFEYGLQPWYVVHQRKIKLANRNEMNFKVSIVENAYLEKYHKLYKGFVTVNPHGMFYLLNGMICELTVKIYMGFSIKFEDGFGVEVNNNMALPITFKGNPAIPMLSILNVERPLLNNNDRTLEYKTLNKIFLNEVINLTINCLEPQRDEIKKLEHKLETDSGNHLRQSKNVEEIEEEMDEFSEFSSIKSVLKLKDLYVDKDGRVQKYKTTKVQHRAITITLLDEDVRDYHVLDYPDEYPNIMYIENMIETSKFLDSLKIHEDVQKAFKTIANKHVLAGSLKTDNSCETKKKYKTQIGSFVVHPLPFNTTTYYLPFDYIRLNEELLIPLELFFHGPGKAIFSVRTNIAIPGLTIEFCAPESAEFSSDSAIDVSSRPKFLIYNTKPAIIPGLKYKNKTERDLYNATLPNCSDCNNCVGCENCEIKVCHAHSYDLDLDNVHERDIPNRKLVNEYYTKLNQQYKEEKDPFVLSELYQEDCSRSDETIFVLKIKFFPTSEFYDEEMLFEDYIFIDIHLGPSLPILIRGLIRSIDYIPEDLSDLNNSEDSGLDNKSSK